MDWRSGIADAFRATHVPGEPEELADAWRARYRPILTEDDTGAQPWGNFDDLHLVTLQDLLAERKIELPFDESRRLVSAWHRLQPWPDVHIGLEVLRRRRVRSALSTGHLDDLYELAQRLPDPPQNFDSTAAS